MESISKYVVPELNVILQAPVSFFLCLSVLCLFIWRAIEWRYSAVIDSYEARNKLQADRILDYENKLSGASPDEAKARLDVLEAMVANLSPRSLSEEQSQKLTSLLSIDPGRAYITLGVAAENARSLHAALEKCFREAGYEVQTWRAGGAKITPQNICLRVPNITQPSARQQRVLAALRGLSLDVTVEHEPDRPANKHPIDVWLEVR